MIDKIIYTPWEISRHIKTILSNTFSDIWVDGEISNLRIPSSAHAYFTLKDARSQIRVVMFKSRQRSLRFKLKDGLRVLIRGSIDIYEPRGEYQLIAELVEAKGMGTLEMAFRQLKEKLEREGLFSPAHKRPLPFLPHRIGIITSPTGAAIRDLLKTLLNRFPNLDILIHPVRVQGDDAAEEISSAIREMNQKKYSADLLIITRGGGSIEDLWCFNEESVARAIFESQIPIISAVGHEIDFTISDFVADMRAPTPTAAGELAVPNLNDLVDRIGSLTTRRDRVMHYHMEIFRHRLISCKKSNIFLEPERIILYMRQQLDDLEIRLRETLKFQPEREKISRFIALLYLRNPSTLISTYSGILKEKRPRLGISMRTLIKNNQLHLMGLAGKLDSLSPLAILGRGYSICRRLPDYRIVTDSRDIMLDDKISIRLKKGELTCNVSKIDN